MYDDITTDDLRNYFINTTFGSDSFGFDSDSVGRLDFGWHLEVYVNDSYTGNDIEGAFVNWADAGLDAGNPSSKGSTSESGWFKGYVFEKTKSRNNVFNHNNYTFNVSKEGYSYNYTNVNVTANLKLFFSLKDTVPPIINFVPPTPDHEDEINQNNVYVNVSSSDVNKHYTFVDWDESLVGWWRFENGSLEDESSYDNHLTAGSTSATENGAFGDARYFPGSTGLTLSDRPSIRLGDAITLSAWIYLEATDDYHKIIMAKAGEYLLRINEPDTKEGGKLSCFIRLDGDWEPRVAADTDIPLNEWTHVACLWDSSGRHELYINGTLEAFNTSRTGTVNTLTHPFEVGLWGNANNAWKGSIDEVMVFNRALSVDEVKALYDAGANQYENNFTDLSNDDYSFKAFAVDIAGNKNETETRTVTVNVVPPIVEDPVLYSGTYHPNGNSGAYFKGSVGIRSGVIDSGNGLNTSSCEININSEGWTNSGVTYSAGYCQYSYSDTSNINSVRFRIKDNNKNTGTSNTSNFIYDSTPPTTTPTGTSPAGGASYTYDTWTNQSSVGTTLSCDDGSGSGCDTIYYCVDTTNTCAPTTVYSSIVSVTNQGTNYIRFRSNDNLGNIETTQSRTIKIDSMPPVVGAPVLYSGTYHPTSYTGSYFKGSVGIRSSVSDISSGLDTESCEISINGGAWTNTGVSYSSGYCQYTYSTTSDISNVQFRINDNVGNTGISSSSNFIYDATPPTTTPTGTAPAGGASYTYNTWTNQPSAGTTLSCDDGAGVGCNNTYYCTDTTNTCTPETPYTERVDVTTQGTSYIRYQSNDLLGNQETTQSRTIRIDTTPPQIQFVPPTPNHEDQINQDNVYINVSSSDDNNHYTFLDWNNSLVGWWRFEDNNLLDESGNNNHATNHGSTYTAAGKFGGARTFDGISDEIETPLKSEDDNNFFFADSDNEFTVSLWFKGEHGVIAGAAGGVGGSTTFSIYMDDGDLKARFRGNEADLIKSNVSTTTWNHVVVTWDGSNAQGYHNGVAEGTPSIGTANIQNYNFWIGTSRPDLGNFDRFEGFIDEVMVFNRALSVDEIKSLYSATANQYQNNFTDLVSGEYSFKAFAVDEAGNKNETESKSVLIDTLAPVSTIVPDGTDWVSEDVDFDILCADEHSGCAVTYWQNIAPGDNCLNITGVVEVFRNVGNHSWEVPEGVTEVDVLVVGGGGGGGAAFDNSPRYGGGGGAGGLIFEENYDVSGKTSIDVVVGAGGRGSDDRHSTPHRVAGENGENSSFGSLVAIGGGGGSSSSSEDDGRDPAGDGGSGGGGGGGAFSQGAGGESVEDQGHDGVSGTTTYSGGGGGANSEGSGSSGGAGRTIWDTTYASGGDGKTGTHSHGESGADNTGDGGDGSSGNSSNFGHGGDGGSGIVLIRYFDPSAEYEQVSNTITCPPGDICEADICYYSIDIAGNVEEMQRSNTFRIDKMAPDLSVLSPDNNSNFNVSTITFNISSSKDLSWCGLSLNGASNITMTLNSENTASHIASGLSDNHYDFVISCNDTAGNVEFSQKHYFLVDTIPPSIEFVPITPDDEEEIDMNHVYVNASSVDSNNHYTFVDWDDSLVAWWRFENKSLNDESGNDYYGINNGATYTEAGKFGGAIAFSGSSYVETSFYPGESNLGQEFTWSFWNKWNTFGSNTGSHGSGDSPRLYVQIEDSEGTFRTAVGNTFWESMTIPQTNTWYLITIVFDHGTVYTYLNGELQNITHNINFVGESKNDFSFGRGFGDGRFLNGATDEHLIFNRALSVDEIKSLYNATSNQYKNNFTDLTSGDYSFRAFAVDKAGNKNETETRTITINLNNPPNNPDVSINSTNGLNWSNQDLNCFADISDPDGDDLNVSVIWYRNDSFFSAVDYNSSFENGTSFNATLDSSNTAVGDTWHCGMRLHDGEFFSDWVNSTTLEVVNTPPFSVVLLYPEHEDYYFIDRSPEFNWTASFSPDGGELSYEFQINTENNFASPWKNITGIETNKYQWVDEDLDFNTYHWRVRAYDGIDHSDWSNVSNFTVVTFLNVSLTNSDVNFGLVSPGDNASTEHEGEPSPFTFFNYGNVEADLINVSATNSLFQNAELSESNWQVRARPDSTYNEGISITSWTDVSNSISNLIRGFNRSSEVFVDTRISVPFYEPPGETSSNITFTWEVEQEFVCDPCSNCDNHQELCVAESECKWCPACPGEDNSYCIEEGGDYCPVCPIY